MSKEKSVEKNSTSLEQRAYSSYRSTSIRFNLFSAGVLALWGLSIGCGQIYEQKEKALRNQIPELKIIDSAYFAQIDTLDESNPRYHALCDSITKAYNSKIEAVKETYNENGLLK